LPTFDAVEDVMGLVFGDVGNVEMEELESVSLHLVSIDHVKPPSSPSIPPSIAMNPRIITITNAAQNTPSVRITPPF
jgi:hypothetical protein